MRTLAIAFFMLVALLTFNAPLLAQAGPNGGPLGLPGDHTLSIADTSAPLGGTVDIPVSIETTTPTFMVIVSIANDSTQLSLTGWSPGSGLQAHIDANGQPPSCDVVVYPDGMVGLMFLGVEYDSNVSGTEWIVLHYDVPATVAGTTTIEYSDLHSQVPETATVTLSPANDIVRQGDVNGDTVCGLADAIKLLAYLFNNDSIPCQKAADVTSDGGVALNDAISLLNSLYGNGVPLDDACSTEANPTQLTCDNSSC